jgi:molybdopterin-containing oxidoreductase family iron-sulfur binding subunit
MGVVEKCTFCAHRTRKGYYPRCVEACPVKARHFGNINDHESEVSKLLSRFQHIRLLEEQGTNPSIYYIIRGVKWGPNGERI